MTLVALKKPPPFNPALRDKYHWNHYIDHKLILQSVAKKTGTAQHLSAIWPVVGNFSAQQAEQHQFLHQQMNLLSGQNTSDLTKLDLADPEQFKRFVELNYSDHLTYHTFVGI